MKYTEQATFGSSNSVLQTLKQHTQLSLIQHGFSDIYKSVSPFWKHMAILVYCNKLHSRFWKIPAKVSTVHKQVKTPENPSIDNFLIISLTKFLNENKTLNIAQNGIITSEYNISGVNNKI